MSTPLELLVILCVRCIAFTEIWFCVKQMLLRNIFPADFQSQKDLDTYIDDTSLSIFKGFGRFENSAEALIFVKSFIRPLGT